MVEEDSYCPQVFGLDCMVELSLGMKQVGILPWEFSVWITWLRKTYCPQVFGLDCMVELSLGMKQVGILPMEFSVWITWLRKTAIVLRFSACIAWLN